MRLRGPRQQPLAGPFHGLAVHALAKQVGPAQRGNAVAGVAPGFGGVLEDDVQPLVEPARYVGLARALPVAAGAAAVPGLGGKAQHVHRHAGHGQRAAQQVHQQGQRARMRLHRARAVQQDGHGRIADGARQLVPEDGALLRIADQLRQPACIQVPILQAELPAVVARHGQALLQVAGQPARMQALRASSSSICSRNSASCAARISSAACASRS